MQKDKPKCPKCNKVMHQLCWNNSTHGVEPEPVEIPAYYCPDHKFIKPISGEIQFAVPMDKIINTIVKQMNIKSDQIKDALDKHAKLS